jgi:hypothetical protein
MTPLKDYLFHSDNSKPNFLEDLQSSKEIRSNRWIKNFPDDLNPEELEILEKTKKDFYFKNYNSFE